MPRMPSPNCVPDFGILIPTVHRGSACLARHMITAYQSGLQVPDRRESVDTDLAQHRLGRPRVRPEGRHVRRQSTSHLAGPAGRRAPKPATRPTDPRHRHHIKPQTTQAKPTKSYLADANCLSTEVACRQPTPTSRAELRQPRPAPAPRRPPPEVDHDRTSVRPATLGRRQG
jgi:hypothetical protein